MPLLFDKRIKYTFNCKMANHQIIVTTLNCDTHINMIDKK